MARLRPTTLVPLCLFLVGAASASDFGPGLATVTTVQGDCNMQATDGARIDPELHANIVIDATRIETGKDGRLALSLSNGLGLATGRSTSVEVIEFVQQPFEAERESLTEEPSRSKLHLRLDKGQIALAHPAPSPLSDLRILCREGELRFHRGRCVVAVDEAGTRIFTDEGSMTFVYPDGSGREFLAAGSALLISPQSASRNAVALRGEAVPRDSRFAALSAAAQGSRLRVLHRPGPDGFAEHPMLVTPAKPADTETTPEKAK